MRNYTIDDLLDEADIAISDSTWTIATSKRKSLFNKDSFINYLLFSQGIIGGAIALGRIINKKQKEQQAKEIAIQKTIAKQNAVIKALQKKSLADKERIESLTKLNTLLTEAIRKLQEE